MTIGLLAALTALALAPLLMPDTYSVRGHSVSESAAQGVEGAWLARLGFLLFGFAVLSLALDPGSTWGRWGRRAHAGFGVSMIAAAVFLGRGTVQPSTRSRTCSTPRHRSAWVSSSPSVSFW